MLFEKREMARMDFESMWQGIIAEKDAEIADNYAEIARLRAQLEKRNAENG